MARHLVAARAALSVCATIHAGIAAAHPPKRTVTVNRDSVPRGQIALIIDPGGIEWCDDDKDICARVVRVLSVIRGDPHVVPELITLVRQRSSPPITTPQLFLRKECGTGRHPLWRAFPAAHAVTENSPFYGALFTTAY